MCGVCVPWVNNVPRHPRCGPCANLGILRTLLARQNVCQQITAPTPLSLLAHIASVPCPDGSKGPRGLTIPSLLSNPPNASEGSWGIIVRKQM